MKKIFTLVLCLSFLNGVYGQKAPFTLDDIYKVKGVGAPVLSPSGKYFAYTVTESTLNGGKSKTAVYLYDIEKKSSSKPEMDVKNSYNPFWGKSDNILYFTAVNEGKMQVFSYDFSSKTKRQLTKYFNEISNPILTSDERFLVFTSDVYPDCNGDQECNQKNIEAAEKGPVQAYMTDELLYRHWTEYSEGRVSHILVMDLSTSSIKDITPYNYNCPAFSTGGGGFAISPDNKFLVYSANPLENKGNNTNTDLWLYNMLTGQTENITKDNTGSDGGAVFSPDGKYIAYKFQRQGGYESDRFILALYDMQTKSRTVLTEDFDNWVTDAVWAPDSKSIFFAGDVLGYTPVFKLDVDTKKYAEVIPSRAVGGFIPSKTGAELYFTSRLMNSPVDIYCQNLKDSKETRLTFHNEEITQKVDFRTPQALWIPGADGKKVHVWLVTPHNFDPAKKYPLIINVHGGPQSQWMDAYRPDAQVYSGYGYIVAFPNPHGSTGYGQSYTAAISGDWGGKVYQDVMMVTDYLAKLPYVDSTRMAAMGWSYGGYMMNWLQGHTKRFKCLASMMGLYNLESFYGTTEELWFPEWDLKGTPWGNPELYEKYSPSKFVKNFATPTLIITGEKDFRVSYTQSMEYFTALKKQNIDARLVIFKNDGHWPSGIKSMPLYYNAHLEWFNKYLGGEPAPYDSKKLIRNMETIK